ncbi:MAG: hypothetical protein IT337_09545, partial [Thermomicrobiales bacterium]|nr:hypothetical protein [Thermomicrobiales bacterium]
PAAASARDRVERALLLRPAYADALVLKGNLQLTAQDWSGAITAFRRAADSDAATARRALVEFLARHEPVLKAVPAYSGSAARAERGAAIASPRKLLRSVAFWSFLVGLVFVLAGAQTLGWTLAVAAPLALMLYRARRWPPETAALRAEWESRDAERRQLLSSQRANVAELLAAAGIVADRLRQNGSAEAAPAAQPAAPRRAPARGWETCQIVERRGRIHGPSYEVQASSPGGDRKLTGYGERQMWVKDSAQARRHVAKIGQHLIAEGWDPLPGGADWWNLRFRRPAR